MARVVQKRTNPPYLLFMFVFLFLLASALAVMFYLDNEKSTKAAEEAKEELGKYASRTERNRDQIRQMVRLFERPPKGESPKTVCAQLDAQIDKLTKLITGTETSFEEAEIKAKVLQKKIGSFVGLVNDVETAITERESAVKDKSDYAQDVTGLKTKLAALSRSKDDLVEDHKKDLADKDAEVNRVTGELTAQSTAHIKAIENLNKGFEKTVGELNNNITTKIREITGLDQENKVLRGRISHLESELREKELKVDPDIIIRQADGKIGKVVAQAGLCYINIGSKDNVMAGLTFSVYPRSGVAKDKVKGSIAVTSVFENVSECQITTFDKNDPLMPGDLIANVAFDSTRTYTFLIQGQFNLSGAHRATPEGAEEVEAIVKRFGGKITDNLDNDTDFVVMGAEPTPPPKPDESASKQEWQIYEEQLNVQKRYNRVKLLAQSLHKMILNTNSFLALTGYMPLKEGRP